MSKGAQIAALTAKVDQLNGLLQAALLRILELEQQLGRNSRNSNKPPSSDGLSKKPAFPRRKGIRKSGGQAGHPGKTLKMVDQPTHQAKHPLVDSKCTCGGDLTDVKQEDHWDKRQVFDLPPTVLEVTQHEVARKTCPGCQRIHLGNFPIGVTAPVQYGQRVRALAVLLNVEQSMPLARVQELFAGLTGYGINESTVHSAVERMYDQLEPEEQMIRQAALESKVAHADETGGRIAGKLHWIHGLGTLFHTLYVVSTQRGGKVISGRESHLAGYTGRLIHDCYASYFKIAGDIQHGVCNAHLLRELAALMEVGALTWPAKMHELLLDYYRLSDQGRSTVADQGLKKLNHRYAAILKLADEEEPPPAQGKRGRPKQSKGRNLRQRFEIHEQSILAFANYANVPFTNNLGERDLRPWKTKLKVSGCFRTLVGAQRYARIKGFCSTAKKNGHTVFDQLVAAQAGNSFLRLT